MTTIRILLVLAGIWFGWYGIGLLLDFPRADLISIALWFGGAILLHDAIFAPLSALVGVTARRILPGSWWGLAACGAVCTVALVLIAAPVLGRGHAMPDNPTVLDRNYPLGLTVTITLIWVLVAVTAATRFRRTRTSTSPDTATPRSTP
ncbi:hypothetical protein [Nocardia sp. NPDC049149]|uniref:hypothetical protein n=1 Tax=Nocardia sp. NPDC049149 TaxID=3364315 RepID=UPI003711249C